MAQDFVDLTEAGMPELFELTCVGETGIFSIVSDSGPTLTGLFELLRFEYILNGL